MNVHLSCFQFYVMIELLCTSLHLHFIESVYVFPLKNKWCLWVMGYVYVEIIAKQIFKEVILTYSPTSTTTPYFCQHLKHLAYILPNLLDVLWWPVVFILISLITRELEHFLILSISIYCKVTVEVPCLFFYHLPCSYWFLRIIYMLWIRVSCQGYFISCEKIHSRWIIDLNEDDKTIFLRQKDIK